MRNTSRIGIVASLEREVWPLVRDWPARWREYEGRRFKFFEGESSVVVCSGIGSRAARRATEAIIQLYRPAIVISAGFAGALEPRLKVGSVLIPKVVIDAGDASRTDTGTGQGILVSFDAVIDPAQKAKLARAYGAQAVDMEGAAVARGAEAHGLRFIACKAISDGYDFRMPPVGRFVAQDGSFRSADFAVHVALRPWLWRRTAELARNSARAARALCQALADLHEMRTEAAPILQTTAGVKS